MESNSPPTPPCDSRTAQALQHAEDERERRKAEERNRLENPARNGVDLATERVARNGYAPQQPHVPLGDLNSHVDRIAQADVQANAAASGSADVPQTSGFQAINKPDSNAAHAPNSAQMAAARLAHQQGYPQGNQELVRPPPGPGPYDPNTPVIRVIPRMGVFSLPTQRPQDPPPTQRPTQRPVQRSVQRPAQRPATRPPPLPVQARVSRPRSPAALVPQSSSSSLSSVNASADQYFSSSQSSSSSDAPIAKPHTTFKQVTIHTAKCDVCNRHNKSTLHRCADCGWQICTPCWDKRGGNGYHGVKRKFKGPTFGQAPVIQQTPHIPSPKKVPSVQPVQGLPQVPQIPKFQQGQQDQRFLQVPQTTEVQQRQQAQKSPQVPQIRQVQQAQRPKQGFQTPRAQPLQQVEKPFEERDGIKYHDSDETLSFVEDDEFPRPPTRGKGKGMGRIENNGDVAMSGTTEYRESEAQRRMDAAMGLMMLRGQIPREPQLQAPAQRHAQMPAANTQNACRNPGLRYENLAPGDAKAWNYLVAAAERLCGDGEIDTQAGQVAQAAHTQTQAPSQIPMSPPPNPGVQYRQANPGSQQVSSSHTEPSSNSNARPTARTDGIRRTERGEAQRRRGIENYVPRWTPEKINSSADHFEALKSIGLTDDREFPRVPVSPPQFVEPPEIPPDAVYKRQFEGWASHEQEARKAEAEAAAATRARKTATFRLGPRTPGYFGADGHTSAASPNITGVSTAGSGDSVIPRRRAASDSFSDDPRDPKRQATCIDPVSQIPTPPIEGDKARFQTRISANNGNGNFNVNDSTGDTMEIDSGRAIRANLNPRARAWEL